MNRPSGSVSPRYANRWPGSEMVTGCGPNGSCTTPSRTSVAPMNQEVIPGPVAIACQTSSTVASTSASFSPENSYPMSGHLALGEEGGQRGRDDLCLDLMRLTRQRLAAGVRQQLGQFVLGVTHPCLAFGAVARPDRDVDRRDRLGQLGRN